MAALTGYSQQLTSPIYAGYSAERQATLRALIDQAKELSTGPVSQEQQAAYRAKYMEFSHKYGQTPLHIMVNNHTSLFAAEDTDLASIRHITHIDPSLIDIRTNKGQTPLFEAVARSGSAAVRALLQARADPNTVEPVWNYTPLHLALHVKDPESAKALLLYGGRTYARLEGMEREILEHAKDGLVLQIALKAIPSLTNLPTEVLDIAACFAEKIRNPMFMELGVLKEQLPKTADQ